MRLLCTLLKHKSYQQLGGDQMQSTLCEMSCAEEFELYDDLSNIAHLSIYRMLRAVYCKDRLRSAR